MSPNVNKEWNFTCRDCPYVPYRDENPDTLAHQQQIDADLSPWLMGINPWVPQRCTSCDTAKKRNQRMRKRTKRIWRLAEDISGAAAGDECNLKPGGRSFSYPKLITFALLTPTYFTDQYSTRYDLLQDLSRIMPKARRILMRNGVLGGTFVFECNSRLTPIDEGQPLFSWRHHPHVHMVAIAPFIHHSKLKKFCELLMPIGLGRINYKAPRSYGVTSRYIAKYLSKQGLNVRSFGIVRKYTLPAEECRCVDDDWPYNQTHCDCIWSDNLA